MSDSFNYRTLIGDSLVAPRTKMRASFPVINPSHNLLKQSLSNINRQGFLEDGTYDMNSAFL